MNTSHLNPKMIYMGITDRCNANCVMCWRRFLHGPFADMDIKVISSMSAYLKTAERIGWWGDGEFFAHNDLPYILDIIRSLPNVQHSFSTNGMGLLEYADTLASLNISHIQVSIDGATAETQASIRRGTDLDQIVKGISAVMQAFDNNKKKPIFTIMMVLMKSNISEVVKMVELANSLSIKKVFLNPLVVHSMLIAHEIVGSDIVRTNVEIAKEKGIELGVELVHCAPQLL